MRLRAGSEITSNTMQVALHCIACLFKVLIVRSSDLFYFAVFSGRDILIERLSLFGDFCTHIECGYPFLPEDLKTKYSSSSRLIDVLDEITEHMAGRIFLDQKLLLKGEPADFNMWWTKYNDTMDCVHKLNGCLPQETACHIAYAMQHIIPGPVIKSPLLERIMGLTNETK